MNFRTLDLNLLRVFDAVMLDGSLTRAAQTLAMTQPAMSHAMKRLREAVGEDLFVRSATGMTPTARAEQLWPAVREALAGLRQALAPQDFDPARDGTIFRIALADATAALLSPGLVAAFAGNAARASLRFLPLTTRDPRRLLEDGGADLAIGFFPAAMADLAAQGLDAPLRHTRLYATRYRCVMRRGHPLAEVPLTLDNYCAAQHLLVSFSGHSHGYVDQALAAVGRQRRVVLTVNQFFTAGRVVTQSDLLTVLPESFIDATGYRRQLVARELPMILGPVTGDMLWHRRQDGDPANAWLRAQVVRAAALATEADEGTETPAATSPPRG